MKERSKQQPSSRQKIRTTIRTSENKSRSPQQASALRTASTRILSVLDPRVQRVARSVVDDRRPSLLKRKKLSLMMDRTPFKIHSKVELTDEQIDQLDAEINKLQGEQKREETIREKNNRHPKG